MRSFQWALNQYDWCPYKNGKCEHRARYDKGPYSQSYGFSSSHVQMWELDHKESWASKNLCFWTVVLEKILESPLDRKEIKPVNPKENQPRIFIGRTDAKAEAPVLCPPNVKSWLIGKDPDAGKDWEQEEKREREDEMIGWHHWLSRHEFEQTLGNSKRRKAWHAAVHWVTKSWPWLNDWTTITDVEGSSGENSCMVGMMYLQTQDHQKLPENHQRLGQGRKRFLYSFQREHRPADTLILDV